MAKKKTTKKVSFSEFQSWLQGVEDMQPAEWSPDKQQWDRIREKLNSVVISSDRSTGQDTQQVVRISTAGRTSLPPPQYKQSNSQSIQSPPKQQQTSLTPSNDNVDSSAGYVTPLI